MNMAPSIIGGPSSPQMQQQPAAFNTSNPAMNDAYQQELIKQLRGGSYQNPQGVMDNASANYNQAMQDQAMQEQKKKEMLMQQEQQPAYQWFAGDSAS